jgi:hypothetical protein
MVDNSVRMRPESSQWGLWPGSAQSPCLYLGLAGSAHMVAGLPRHFYRHPETSPDVACLTPSRAVERGHAHGHSLEEEAVAREPGSLWLQELEMKWAVPASGHQAAEHRLSWGCYLPR